jgi:cytochrome c oxidase subunit 6b
MSSAYPKGISKLFTAELPEMTKEEQARFNMMRNIRTTPRDERFPSTNQALHCWNRYNEWLLCVKQSGDEDGCKPMRFSAESMCPGFWIEQFDEQRDEGKFSGIGHTYDEQKKHGHHDH